MQGDEIDRYSLCYGILWGMGGGGTDDNLGYHQSGFDARDWMGPNHPDKKDAVRRWVASMSTDDRRTLQNPADGGRRESELDDHKETMPATLDGPHLYGSIKLPRGRYVLSCYFFNENGHGKSTALRDYVVEARPTPVTYEAFDSWVFNGGAGQAVFDRAPPGRRSRVYGFWGGVYKRFYIAVDAKDEYWTVRVNASFWFNTMWAGFFVDPVAELHAPFGPGALYEPAEPREAHLSHDAAGSRDEPRRG